LSTRARHPAEAVGDEVAPPLGAVRHGVTAPRGHALPLPPGGRFGLMFEDAAECQADRDALRALADDMVANAGRGEENEDLPSGYTYLGQFVDHDLTFDPASSLQRRQDPEALWDFRTPALDLDSLYGSGPDVDPFLYDREGGRELGDVRLLGRRDAAGRIVDVPRNDQGVALVGDARNDENLVVSQLHLLFLRFHNIMVGLLRDEGVRGGRTLLLEAQRRVRWHYQWIVVHDFLPAFTGAVIAPAQRTLFNWRARQQRPFMPVEFSAAAYRCGHSMVRSSYRVQPDHLVPLFAPDGQESLRGRTPLTPELRVDWSLFFLPSPEAMGDRTNRAMRVDDRLAPALAHIPGDGRSLAFLNLRRGWALHLPSGQAVAKAVGEPPLQPADLRLDGVREPARTALQESTPLWFYLLREAAVRGAGGQHLGPIGGRIVGEVILGLLEADDTSYVHADPPWTPELAVDGTFTMHDLITFVKNNEP
jgi:hypothetical protein